LNRKIQLAFVFAVLAFLVLGTISYRNIAASEEREQWVFHTHEVVENLQGLLLAMQNVVSSYRGFVVTGEDSLLAAYPFSVLDVERRKTKVRDLTVDNPVQQHHIPALDTLSAQNIQFAEAVIGERRDNGLQSAAQMLDSGTGDRIMSEFQGVVSEMQDEELRLLTQRNAAAKQRTARAKFTVIVATVLGLLITATAVSSVQRENSKRKLAEETVRENEGIYRMLLEEIQHYAIFTLDPKGIVVSWNAGAERIKGYKADEIIGQNFSCFFTPEDIKRGRPEEVLRMTATTGREKDQGLRVRKDGSRFLASVTFTALRDLAGNLRGYSEVSHDLSESKEAGMKYRGLLEAAPDAMVVVNQGGEIVLLNVQAEKQFGYRRDELIGQQVKNIIPEGFAERLLADGTRTTAEALAQQIGMGIELCGRRKNGSDFPIEIMLSPLESAEGTLVTAAIRDISVRKAAEVHLGQMEGRYRGLLEAAPDAMVVVNESGEIVLLNVQAEKQFGYRRDELVGQKVKNIIPEGFAERLLADDLRSAEDALAQQIGTGIELTGRRKDGSNFPIAIMLSPLESAEGTLVTAAIRDISVRKAAEVHLGQMEGRYRGLLEAAPDAMVVVNQGGEIVLLNVQAEKQFGYRRDELIGQQVKNIIPEGFAERLIADGTRTTAEALAQQIGMGIELRGRRKNGSDFPIEIMLSPLDSAEGILVTAAIRDISTRKRSEAHVQELNRSNEELERFAYVASHDLQEPLRMVASYTQLLSSRYKGKLDADADTFISYAADGANRMQHLIKDLLAYSRVATNAKDLLVTSSEEALQRALRNLGGAIEDSAAQVTHDTLPAVMADQGQLVQLFQNLVGNAIKYQEPGVPKIHISAAKTGNNKWMFSVQDNGLGIESQYFEKIFGIFQRLHKREEFTGTGIGLAICKKIVERHGGSISVQSQLGQGSTFRFALNAEGCKS
jgi:PAS domain S-box-containing protein